MTSKRRIILGTLVAALARHSFAAVDIDFDPGWKFYRGDPNGAQAPSYADGSWDQNIVLPHTVQVELTLGPNYYVGPCWYRKTFTPDASMQGKKVVLELEAGMQTAQLWINGVSLVTHLGGYTPIVVDITKNLTIGSPNTIAVRLDNAYSSSFGPGIQYPDFDYFGGLYRKAYLHVTELVHITDPMLENIPGGGGVFVTFPSVSTSTATVQVKTHVRNESSSSGSLELRTTLLSPSGAVAGTATSTQTVAASGDYTYTQAIQVSSPALWSPDSPSLYLVRSQLSLGGSVTDTVSTEIGIRTIKYDRSGFWLNGKILHLRGADRHQDYPFVGNAVPPSGQYRDALLLKEGGFNFVRMSHYVNSIDFIKACDRLGIVGMACIPGWHSPGGATFWANSYIDIQQMVRYYRNHPSVALWEVVHNESQGNDGSTTYPTTANATAVAEYPGGQMYSAGENKNTNLAVWTPTEQSSARSAGATSTRPIVMSEYGDWDYGGDTSTSRVLRSDGEAAMLRQTANHQLSYNQNMALKWLAGDAIWSYNDYQTKLYGTATILKSGLVDLFRIPKFSFYFYQSQRDPSLIIPGVSSGAMAYIPTFWTSKSALKTQVFSNCDQVRLSLNGSVIATQSPDAGTNFLHPPFTFNIKAFQSGTLLAEGLVGGVVKAAYSVTTPGSPASLKVQWDTANTSLLADGSDFAIANAQVLDGSGNPVPTATNAVTFTISGQGTLVGNTMTNAVGGIASILVKTKNAPGSITVTASAAGLKTGSSSANAGAGATSELSTSRHPLEVPRMRLDVTRNRMTVFLSADNTARNLMVADALGHVVRTGRFTGSESVVDLTGVPRGVYFVSVGRAQGKFFRD